MNEAGINSATVSLQEKSGGILIRTVGFSTGALAHDDYRQALQMLADKPVNAVELSALRQNELQPVVQDLDNLDLRRFSYVAFHAPSSIDPSFELSAIKLLERVAARGWPIIVHPDAMHTPAAWARFDALLCIENMDKRKLTGQTAADLVRIFHVLPRASFCFDIGHARQVDPTMSEATAILQVCSKRLKQLHVSDVNTQSKHDPLSLESMLAFQRVASLVPQDIPVIMESRVDEGHISEELGRALESLAPNAVLAMAGD
jgi:hypothetical protein